MEKNFQKQKAIGFFLISILVLFYCFLLGRGDRQRLLIRTSDAPVAGSCHGKKI